MALIGKGRLLQAEASRTVIYVSQFLVKDSQFPFKPGDALNLRLDTKTKSLIVTKRDED